MVDFLTVEGAPLKRLMKLCRMISAGNAATISELESKLKVSRRTIFRDLNVLADWGIKVELGDRGYQTRKSPTACRKVIAGRQVKKLNKLLALWLK